MKRPSFQFYPADWRKDSALQACSLAARALWIELMCVMHECDPYGVLAINGNAMSPAQISRLIGESPATIKRLLAELEQSGVFSRTEEGAIYSRRMRKDEHLREVRAAAGRLGGNPNLLNQNDKQKAKQDRKQNPTPSSSSSSTEAQEPKASPHAPSSQDPPQRPTEAARACLLLRQAGCIRFNPSNPNLLAALAEGVTPETIRDTYLERPDATNPFAWAIATARSRHAEGANPIHTGNPHEHANRGAGRKPSAVELVEQAIRERRAHDGDDDGPPLAVGHG